MKLFYSKASCSMAVHIALHEFEKDFLIERVDLKAKTFSGGDFLKINPKGYVPVLELDNGEKLTEVTVILQYLADLYPEKKLAPAIGTIERYRFQEWLNYIATEVHKGFSPLWNPRYDESTKAIAKEILLKKFDFIDSSLKTSPYITGSSFTVADAYLFTVLNWATLLKMDLTSWPSIQEYLNRIQGRASVQAALKAEGLLKSAA